MWSSVSSKTHVAIKTYCDVNLSMHQNKKGPNLSSLIFLSTTRDSCAGMRVKISCCKSSRVFAAKQT